MLLRPPKEDSQSGVLVLNLLVVCECWLASPPVSPHRTAPHRMAVHQGRQRATKYTQIIKTTFF